MYRIACIAAFVLAGSLPAQEAAKPAGVTAEQIIEKSIEAMGGRAAMEKITSTVSKGTVTMAFAGGMTAGAEFYAKSPNKFLMVMNMEGFGQVRQGFDGAVGWSEDPQRGLREITGEQLEQLKRQAVMNSALKWREMYPKVELKGKEKVGDADAWSIVLTPTQGAPVTQYFDAANYRLLRLVTTQKTDQGDMEVKVDFLDYRDVGGVKTPFEMKQTLPMGEMSFKFSEIKQNVEIEDAKFTKPAK